MSAVNRRSLRLALAAAWDLPGCLPVCASASGTCYSLRTEQAYVHWARAFVRYHGMCHPRDRG
jgi:hypothetical protein